MERISVKLSHTEYDIIVENGLRTRVPTVLRERFPKARIVLVVTSVMNDLYRLLIEQWSQELNLVVCVVPDGEEFKLLSTWEQILATMLSARLDRSTVVMALGGGVVGDMAGFAAATYLRGVACVQIPTTLLAMVDSSIGGKTGVNHAMGKNMIGAFHQPALVLADPEFLTTLPKREYAAGYAELFKNAFIGGPEMFSFVKENHAAMVAGNHTVLAQGIFKSMAIKARVVMADERETTGTRALLNFGHTFAHAIEHFFHFKGVIHGEAVWYGIACALELGIRIGTIEPHNEPEYRTMLDSIQFPTLPAMPNPELLLAAMASDKKVVDGAIRFVLPTTLGTSVSGVEADHRSVLSGMEKVFSQRMPKT